MAKPPSKDSPVKEEIVKLAKRENPENIRQLLDLVEEKMVINENEAMQHILHLITEKRIALKKPLEPPPEKIEEYVFSNGAYWFWIAIALSVVTAITVFTISEDAYPAVYLRYLLGSAFVLCLPGYAFIKVLYPTQVPIKTSSENLDTIERVALSLGMSLALVPIVSLLLNYTPWGIRLTSITLSLLSLTIVLAITALAREYQAIKVRANI